MNSSALVIGHRGASGYRPEHSRSAYELAFHQGADAVEPDLVTTSDGVLVIRHENEISGTTDVADRANFADRRTTKTIDGESLTGWFTEDFTWAELSTLRVTERLPGIRPHSVGLEVGGILRFTDLLEMLDGLPPRADGTQIGLVAEIKHASYFASIGMPLDELFAAELAEAGWMSDPRLTVESFELAVLGRIRARGVSGRLVFLVEADGAPADDPATPYAQFLTVFGLERLHELVDGISVDKHLLLEAAATPTGELRGAALVDAAHAVGLSVFCWTLRAENVFLPIELRIGAADSDFGDWRTEFTHLLQLGVDGVFADQPDLAIHARGLAAQ